MSTEQLNPNANSASEITQESEMPTKSIYLKANSASEINEPVANSIRKSLNHAEYEFKPDNNILIDFGKTEDRENDKHLQCYVAATRSRSKQSDEKVPDIFPLHGEHRKPEHINKPRRKDDGHSTT